MSIKTTGNRDIDQATAEIAVALRNAEPPGNYGYRDQHYYDEAMRLRDAIMAGTRELDADEPTPEEAEQAHDIWVWEQARASEMPCSGCGGGYVQEYIGPPATSQYIDHERGCTVPVTSLVQRGIITGRITDTSVDVGRTITVDDPPWMADTDPGYDNGMTGPVM